MNRERISAVYVTILLIATTITSIFSNYFLFIRPGHIILVSFSLFFAYYFINIVSEKAYKKTIIKLNAIDVSVLLIAVYYILRYFFSPEYRIIPEKFITQIVFFISYAFLRNLCVQNRNKNTQIILYILLSFGLIQCFYALAQWFSIAPNIFNAYKIGGSYGNPGDLANVLTIIFALTLGLFTEKKENKVRYLFLVIALFCLLIIILSNSRTSWIAVIFISTYLFRRNLLLLYKITKYRLRSELFYGIIILIVLLGIFTTVNLYNHKKKSSEGRLFIWNQCIELIIEKPLFGHGYDSFIPVYSEKQSSYFRENPDDIKNSYLASDIVFAYNDYIQTGVEYGLIGLCLLIYLLYLVFIRDFIKRENTSQYGNILNASLLGIIISMLFSFPLQNNTILFILFLLSAIKASFYEGANCKISLKKHLYKCFTILSFILICCSTIVSFTYIKYSILWKKTNSKLYSIDGNYVSEYEKLLKLLKYDKYFLYNYGYILYSSGEYDMCIKLYENYKECFYDSKTLIRLAECYENIGDYKMAEKNYIKASNTKPVLFVPKYRLFLLYKKTNQPKKALEIALIIKNMNIKVYSETVNDIKTEINEYLLTKEFKILN